MNFIDKIRLLFFSKTVSFYFKNNTDAQIHIGRSFRSKRFSGGYAISHSEGITSINNFTAINRI